MLTVLLSLSALAASQDTFCDKVEALDATLYEDFGVHPSNLSGYADREVVASLAQAPQDILLGRIALVRTMIWSNTFAYRLDATGNVPDEAGTWRYGRVSRGRDSLDVVHWQDIDDQSWSVYFGRDGLVCAVTYEN